MAQWRALHQMLVDKKIPDTELCRIYGSRMHFPISFRVQYATWIESTNWDGFAESGDKHNIGEIKFNELLAMMKSDMEAMQPVAKMQFSIDVNDFENYYQGEYEAFIEMIRNILRNERNMLKCSQEDMGDDRRCDVAKENKQLVDAVNSLSVELKGTKKQLERLEQVQGQGIPQLVELQGRIRKMEKQKESQNIQHVQAEILKATKESTDLTQKIHSERVTTVQMLDVTCRKMQDILKDAWKELDQWKEDQRVACTMMRKPKEGIMEILDSLFEGLAAVFVTVLSQQDRLVNLMKQLDFRDDKFRQKAENTENQLDQYLIEHLRRVFIVDRIIPKQVLKVTNGKSLGFSMSVRLLGGHALGLNANKPKVSVKLYPEKQLEDVMERDADIASCCTIQNNKDKSFQFLNQRSCFASFDHMVVSGVKREGKGRNDDFVTDYKHAFVFFTTVKIQEKTIPLKTMSLPIVITSQTSQECMARGTIIWGAAFPKAKEDRRMPFDAQEEVKWKDFATVMNAMFKEYTKRPLTRENLNFLAKKAFREGHDLDFDKQSISLKSVLKDKLIGCEFPFWKWFMSCMNSVKDVLISEWKEGLIYGFISKTQAEKILVDKSCGTFLIRFSESHIEQGQRADIHGSLTVAVREIHPQTGQPTVFHIKESLSHKDLNEKRLGPILEAYQVEDYSRPGDNATKKLLTKLWTPDREYTFEDVFGKHIKDKENMNDGYQRGRYVIEIFLADQNPRRSSTQSQYPMSPNTIPPSPAQSDYSDMPASPMSDLSGINMSEMGQFSLQQLAVMPPATQQVREVARVMPVQTTPNAALTMQQGTTADHLPSSAVHLPNSADQLSGPAGQLPGSNMVFDTWMQTDTGSNDMASMLERVLIDGNMADPSMFVAPDANGDIMLTSDTQQQNYFSNMN